MKIGLGNSPAFTAKLGQADRSAINRIQKAAAQVNQTSGDSFQKIEAHEMAALKFRT